MRAKAIVFGGALAVLFATFLTSRVVDHSLEELSQDPTETLDAPAYIGLLSTFDLVAWSIGLGACVLGWIGTGTSVRSPFLWGGVLTLAALADDGFRLHESYYPSVGVGEKLLAVLYAAAGLAYVWRFRHFLLRHGAGLFALAIVLLVLSLSTDQLLEEDAPWLTEEGAKFVGIVAWAFYFCRACLAELGSPRAASSSR
ncbi:MAG: hypothetical protein ABI717_00370 [Actinomycetota bacterium]